MPRNGFSLVELIITLVLVAVLAVSVAPRFIGIGSVDAYALQTQLMNTLRLLQLQAMQNTQSACSKLIISATMLAPPDFTVCDNTLSTNHPDYLILQAEAGQSVTFSAQTGGGAAISQLQFDSFGRPTANNGAFSCSSGCVLSIASDDTVSVCLSAEGAITAQASC